ncbi:hypothetical protein Q7P37_008177 [Cladosporium fusiforme]
MAPNNEPTLTGLPTELLSRVVDYVTDEAILQLRHTSHKLQKATFDRFIEAYVAEQSCWIYDKKRWERLDSSANMSMVPHLLAKVRSVTLTNDLVKSSMTPERHLATVPRQPSELDTTEHDVDDRAGLALETYDMYFSQAQEETDACIHENEIRRQCVNRNIFTAHNSSEMCRLLSQWSSDGYSLHLDLPCVYEVKMPDGNVQDCRISDWGCKHCLGKFFGAIAASDIRFQSIGLSPTSCEAFELVPTGSEQSFRFAFSDIEKVSLKCFYTVDDFEELRYFAIRFQNEDKGACRMFQNAHRLRELEINLGNMRPLPSISTTSSATISS